jgi:WD40 repeat protein
MLAAGDWSGAVQIWDATSGQQIDTVDLHGRVHSVAFSPDGEYFAASGDEGASMWIRRIQLGPRKEDVGFRLALRTPIQITAAKKVCAMVFSPDSELLAWSEDDQPGTAHVWNLAGGQESLAPPLQISGRFYGIAFYPNSRLLTIVGHDKAAEVWDVTTRQRTLRYAGPEHVSTDITRLLDSVALSDDGRWAARDVATDLGCALTIWDPETQRLLLKLPEEHGAIWAFAWSPDRSLLAVGTSTGGPVIWNIPKIRQQLAELGLDW